jgi:hypothetical protein
MSSVVLQVNISNESALFILGVLIMYLTTYLHIALYYNVMVFAVPITLLTVMLSLNLGGAISFNLLHETPVTQRPDKLADWVLTNTEYSVALTGLITILIGYLYMGLNHDTMYLSIPITLVIILLTATLGSVFTVLHNIQYVHHITTVNKPLFPESDDETEGEADAEAEGEGEGAAEAEGIAEGEAEGEAEDSESVSDTIEETPEEAEYAGVYGYIAQPDEKLTVEQNYTNAHAIHQLREWAAAINAKNLALAPEELFEPRPASPQSA